VTLKKKLNNFLKRAQLYIMGQEQMQVVKKISILT